MSEKSLDIDLSEDTSHSTSESISKTVHFNNYFGLPVDNQTDLEVANSPSKQQAEGPASLEDTHSSVKKKAGGLTSQKVTKCPAKKGVGRPKHKRTELLVYFLTKFGNSLKREYVCIQIIRGIKKSITWILVKHCPPQKGILQIDLRNSQMQQKWQEFEDFVWENEELFVSLGFTEKRERKFNTSYFRQFYKRDEVKYVHFLYLQLIYGLHSINPGSLCKTLRVSCCRGEHDEHCVKIWTKLKKYVMVDMIKELGCDVSTIEAEFKRTDLPVEEDTDFSNPDFYLA